jgi:hypothetical protein
MGLLIYREEVQLTQSPVSIGRTFRDFMKISTCLILQLYSS